MIVSKYFQSASRRAEQNAYHVDDNILTFSKHSQCDKVANSLEILLSQENLLITWSFAFLIS